MTTRADLAALLSPTSIETFSQSHWARAPLLARAPAPGRFAGLLDLARFEFLLTTVAATGWLSIVGGGEIKPPAREQLTADATPSMAAIARAVAGKKSLLLLNLHRLDAGVGAFCRGIEADFRAAGIVLGKPVRANAYFTPARAQGLDPHYDDHDVLVLQLHGTKRWRLHGEAVKWPRKPMTQALPRPFVKANPQEMVLAPGDVLYLPRGHVHEAAAQDAASLHLTLSLQPATWAHLFEKLVELEDGLGEPLPVGFAQGAVPRDADKAALARLAAAMAQGVAANRAMRDIVNLTLLEGDLPPNGQLAQMEAGFAIAPDDWLVLADAVFAQLEQDGEVPLLRVPGAAYRTDPRAAAFLAAVACGRPFRLADLDRGPNIPALTELAQQLLMRGILVRSTG